MNISTATPSDEGVETVQHVARLLAAAEARAVDLPGTDAEECDFAFCAALLTSQALRLLPPGVNVDDVAAPTERDPWALLAAAEQLLRSHPIEDLPSGTAHLAADLRDLITQDRP